MKLINLIAFFRQGGTFEDFCKQRSLNAESEVIEIYAQEPVNLESHLGFLPVEETKGKIEYQSQGVKYHNLFDFFYFLEVIDDLKDSEEPSDVELAQQIFSYAMTDV